jgi:tetratricopeptide (TPR) repeat protein
LRFKNPREKLVFRMQAQDTSTFFFFKLWPWVEANLKRIGIGIGIAAAIVLLISFYIWKQDQKEIAAGQELTQLLVSTPPNFNTAQLADSYLQIANGYPDTHAAQRALLQSAATLFAAGRYADAQAQFEEFLNAHPESQFSGRAALGVAASLEARNETNLAVDAYQRVMNGFADPMAADSAKLALARIYESQGKMSDALNFYQDVAQANQNNSIGAEAGSALHAMELQTNAPAASTTTSPATTTLFNLGH